MFNLYCGLCQKDASSLHQGVLDLKWREKSTNHLSLAQAMHSSGSLYAMGSAPVGSCTKDKVRITLYLLLLCTCLDVVLLNHWLIVRAEVKIAVAFAHHNIPLAVLDHVSPLFQDIFHDSKLAKGVCCCEYKTYMHHERDSFSPLSKDFGYTHERISLSPGDRWME